MKITNHNRKLTLRLLFRNLFVETLQVFPYFFILRCFRFCGPKELFDITEKNIVETDRTIVSHTWSFIRQNCEGVLPDKKKNHKFLHTNTFFLSKICKFRTKVLQNFFYEDKKLVVWTFNGGLVC